MATPNVSCVTISAAAPLRDGTGSSLGWTAGASGGYIETICIKATGRTDPGMVRMFYNNGATYFLRFEQPVSHIIPDRITQTWEASLSFVTDNSVGMPVDNTHTLYFSTDLAQEFDITIHGYDN